MSQDAVSFALKPNLDQLGELNRRLEEFGEANCLNPAILFELNLALDELVTNIIVHGRQGGGGNDIQVRLANVPEGTEVVLMDDGPAFDPNDAPVPDTVCDLASRCVGGLGIHLAKKLMDSMTYEYTDGHNIITLRKTNVPRCGK